MKKNISCLLLLFWSFGGIAQEYGSGNFRKSFSKADGLVYDGKYMQALPILEELYKFDTTNANLNYLLGVCYLVGAKNHDLAIERLESATKSVTLEYNEGNWKEKNASGKAYYYLGRAYHYKNRFDRAITNYYNYRSFIEMDDVSTYNQVRQQIQYAENAKELIKNPIEVEVENLGRPINTKFPDYCPVVSADGRVLIFTSRREGGTSDSKDGDGNFYDDIYVCTKQSVGEWSKPTSIGSNINTAGHEAAIGLSPDGQLLFIYKDDNNDGNIYQSRKTVEGWSNPEALGSDINTSSWETHATITASQNLLVFTSNRSEGGYGGRDLWYAKRLPNGEWGLAQNMGSVINTDFEEDSPFISPDGKTLIFSSQGHTSMGGFDLFETEFVDGVWTNPENIGYPISSSEDDLFLTLNPNGQTGYYSSSMDGGFGGADLYSVRLKSREKSGLAVARGVMKVPAMDYTDIEARIEVVDEVGSMVGSYVPNQSTGYYVLVLAPGETYTVTYQADGYSPVVRQLPVSNDESYQEYEGVLELDEVVFGEDILALQRQTEQFEKEKEEAAQRAKEEASLAEAIAAKAESEAQARADSLALASKQEEKRKKAEELAAKENEEAAIALVAEEERLRVAELKRKSQGALAKIKADQERLQEELAAKSVKEEVPNQTESDTETTSREEANVNENQELAAKRVEEEAVLEAEQEAAAKAAEEIKLREEQELAAKKAEEEALLEAEQEAAAKAAEEIKLREEQELAAKKAEEEALLEAEQEAAAKAAEEIKLREEQELAAKKAEEEALLEAEQEAAAKAAEEIKLREEQELAAKKAEEEALLEAEQEAAAKAAEEAKLREEFEQAAKKAEEVKLLEEQELAASKTEDESAPELASESQKRQKLQERIQALKAKQKEQEKAVNEVKEVSVEKMDAVKEEIAVDANDIEKKRQAMLDRIEELKNRKSQVKEQKVIDEKAVVEASEKEKAAVEMKEQLEEEADKTKREIEELEQELEGVENKVVVAEDKVLEAREQVKKAEEKLAEDLAEEKRIAEEEQRKKEEAEAAAKELNQLKELEIQRLEQERIAAEKLEQEQKEEAERTKRELIQLEALAEQQAQVQAAMEMEERKKRDMEAAEANAYTQQEVLENASTLEQLRKLSEQLIKDNLELKKELVSLNAKLDLILQRLDSQPIAEKVEMPEDRSFRNLQEGRRLILRNIFFDYNQATLRSRSIHELNKLYDFMKRNPSIKIEVSGHTDSKGNNEYNMRLSKERAQSVVDYLIRNGITSNRLTAVGYGERRPIARNENADGTDNKVGRQLNRRIEISIPEGKVNGVEVEEIEVPENAKIK